MAKISDVKLPNNTTYDIGQSTNIEFIRGTQTAATGTWTGVTTDSELYDGKMIMYYLPFAGSGNATLNLTLADGTTTGAKNCYYNSTSRLTTHYGANAQFPMVYHKALKLSDGNTYEGWWIFAQYDSNTVSQLRWDYSTMTAGAAGIFPYTLVMMNTSGNYESIVTSSSTGTSKARNTAGFIPERLSIVWANVSATSGNKISASNYCIFDAISGADGRYSFNISTTGLTVGKPLYLVGTITNGLFYLDATWWTQTLPTTADGKVYMYVGSTYMPYNYTTDYRFNLAPQHPIFEYKHGRLQLYGTITGTSTGSATTGITASTTATKTTLGTAFSIPNVTSAGSASTWAFEEVSIPNVTAAGSASTWTFEEKSIPNVTAAGSAASASYANGIVTFTNGTAPTLGTAIKVQSKSGGGNGSAPTLGTAIKVQSKKSGANGSAPTLGTAFSVPNVTGNTSATVSITDGGHTHTIS